MNSKTQILRIDASANTSTSNSKKLGDILIEKLEAQYQGVEVKQRDLNLVGRRSGRAKCPRTCVDVVKAAAPVVAHVADRDDRAVIGVDVAGKGQNEFRCVVDVAVYDCTRGPVEPVASQEVARGDFLVVNRYLKVCRSDPLSAE